MAEHPARVCLFTDTLGDVNGVSRFIRDVAARARESGRELHVITSTRMDCPAAPNIHVVDPPWARPMPGYPNLEIVLAPTRRLWALADSLRPTAVHLSTPGPVGLAGLRYARRRGIATLGTYHTDFPAYIGHLFDDRAMQWATSAFMRWFYRGFDRVFTRSADYRRSLVSLGVEGGRIVRLLPGIDTDTFHTRHRDDGLWRRLGDFGVRPRSVKALYVGRVSVEKNLPMLTRIWSAVRARCVAAGVDTQLIIVGDGPYRKEMAGSLGGTETVFLGFRFGAELSAIYAGCDLFIFTSLTDTLGQVVMEAQSAGLPVIVADKGGPSEVVDDGVTGVVLPSERPSEWIDAAAALLCDAPRRASMGAAGHAKIQPMSIRHSFDHFWGVHEEAAVERSEAGRTTRGASAAAATI